VHQFSARLLRLLLMLLLWLSQLLLQLLLLLMLLLLLLLMSVLHLLPHLVGDSNYRSLSDLLWLLRGMVLNLLSGRALGEIVGEGRVSIREPIGHRS
jgi:hypothetical protein